MRVVREGKKGNAAVPESSPLMTPGGKKRFQIKKVEVSGEKKPLYFYLRHKSCLGEVLLDGAVALATPNASDGEA